MPVRRLRFFFRICLLGSLLLLATFAFLLPIYPQNSPVTVDRLDVGESTFLLTQISNGFPDGYRIRLYHRARVGSKWREFFVDHDGPLIYWGTLKAVRAGEIAVFGNGFRLAIFFPREQRILVGRSQREISVFNEVSDPLRPWGGAER